MRPKKPQTPSEAFAEAQRMTAEGAGLRDLLAQMPEGSTLQDAHQLRRKLKQLRRQPSKLLDGLLGIVR